MSGPAPMARWNNPSPTTSKLRDSCHACASSKVKCSKEKPKCTRCVKRRTPCEYLVTKRPGRKHSLHRNAAGSYQAQSLNDGSRPSSAVTNTPLAPANPIPSQQNESIPVSSDIFSGLLSPVDTSLASVFDNMTTSFDDFFSPSIPFPVPNDSTFDLLGHNQLFSSSDSSNTVVSTALTPPKDTIYLFGDAAPEICQPPSGRSPPTTSAPYTPTSVAASTAPPTLNTGPFSVDQGTNHANFQTVEPSCTCSLRALDLMKRLLSDDASPCMLSGGQTPQNRRCRASRSVHSIIAMNKRTIEATITMLQCSCSTDSYLLTIASLIVFKVLSEYAAAASSTTPVADSDGSSPHSSWSARTPNQTPPYSNNGLDDSDGEDQGRLAAQLVLGELHLIQGLVNQLSTKLKAYSPRNATDSSAGTSQHRLSTSMGDRASAFSSAMLDQLEPELRMRIRSLSSEIINLLRQD